MTSIILASAVSSGDKVDSAQPLVKLLPRVCIVSHASDRRDVSHVRHVIARHEHVSHSWAVVKAALCPVRLLAVKRMNWYLS